MRTYRLSLLLACRSDILVNNAFFSTNILYGSKMLGMLGGSFGFSLPQPLPNLSLIYWGTAAFEKLAGGQSDIGVNLLVLAAQGLIFFVVGAWFFRRRLNL